MAAAAPCMSEPSAALAGPAQTLFTSLIDLANFSLSNYWPDWKNYEHPVSYVMPPIFSFKNPEKSDHDIIATEIEYQERKAAKEADEKKLDAARRPVIDRWGDQGEYVVFEALWRLVQDKIQAPLLAIQNFDLSSVESYLDKIFPILKPGISERYKKIIREFDFVLIGPKIGIVLIEVKSSDFTKKKDFSSRNPHLPDQIKHGVDQLNSFDLEFFHECTGIQAPEELKIRKVLFTPNLERCRYDTWLHNLNDGAKIRIQNVMGWNTPDGITHWFRDDMINSGQAILKPPLYSTVKNFIVADNYQISPKIFEAYGALIAGLASVVVLKQQPYYPELNQMKLIESAAVLDTADLMACQNPGNKCEATKAAKSPAKRMRMNPNTEEMVKDKLLLLKPDQQKALAGPERQFVIGAAGTGKSVVLQAKALELLSAGKSVMVFAPSSYMTKYENLFRSHGFTKNFEVRHWLEFKFKLHSVPDSLNGFIEKLAEVWDPGEIWKRVEIFDDAMKNILVNEIFEWLPKFDATLVDDACDEAKSVSSSLYGGQYSLNLSTAMMALAKLQLPQNIIWVAIDPFHHPMEDEDGSYKRTMKKISQENPSSFFSSAPLRLVMRCSEKVYRIAYDFEILPRSVVKQKIGHKIIGFSEGTTTASVKSFNMDQEKELLWQRTKLELDKLQKQGYNYDHIAVIIAGFQVEVLLREYFVGRCQAYNIPANRGPPPPNDKDTGELMICEWSAVSSLEWPVIIFVAVIDKGRDDDVDDAYRRYRACSRATVKIIVVTALYNVWPFSQEADGRVYLGGKSD